MTDTQLFQQPPRALLTLLGLLFVLWFMLGFVFSLVDPDYSLSGYAYLRFALVMMCLALLALGVVWALLGSLVATAATELLGFTSLEQTLFLLIMVGVAAAYSHRPVRTVYAAIVLAFCLYLAWLMEDPLTQLVLAFTLAAVVAVAYLVGRAFGKMRLKQERSEGELVEHQRQRARERRELARELHDSIEHDLTIIGLQAQSVSGKSAEAAAAEELRRIDEHVRSAGEHLRRVLELLTSEGAISESGRDGMDLLTGLEQFSQEIEAAGIPVTQEFSGNPQSLSPSIHTVLYRVLQEASTNVIKYGARQSENPQARCHFKVAIEGDHVDLAVINTVDRERRQTSPALTAGLEGLKERANAFGATVEAGPHGDHEWIISVRGMRTF